ncbi:MAG: type II secretion system protein [Candidatus Yanofskybacteria bacterium]|nr:type II secretion system protein [Candidatus Yanofskybacteria bacterium]
MRISARGSSAFTLIEFLAVFAIIGILTSIVLVQTTSARISARDVARNQNTKTLNQAFTYYVDTYGDFRTITGLPGNNCADGEGWLVSNFPGHPPFCQAMFYSNGNNRPTGQGHNSWETLQAHLAEFAEKLPNDSKNAYSDWGNYPASPAVCPSNCDVNSPLTDGFFLVGITSINITVDLCGNPASMAYFIHTALEDKSNAGTLVNQGYECMDTGNLSHLKAIWGTTF